MRELVRRLIVIGLTCLVAGEAPGAQDPSARETPGLRATQVTVTVEASDGIATVAVADDGIGGAEPRNGTGLVGLTDRIEALGGRLHIDSPRGHGTRLTAEIPCD